MNDIITTLPKPDLFQDVFYVINLLKSNKPSKTFFKTVNPLIEKIGESTYRDAAYKMLSLASEHPITDYPDYVSTFANAYTKHDYLGSETKHFIKGLVWSLRDCADDDTVDVIAALLETSYTKIKDIGPACKLIGNASISVLATMEGIKGLGALSRIKLKLKHASAKKMIDKQLEAGAKRLGVSVENLGEMAVPDFGFE